jgi:hypothetical protein
VTSISLNTANGLRRDNSRAFVSRERTQHILPRHFSTRTQQVLPLEWVREEAEKTPEDDCYWALVYMERMASYGVPSTDIEEIYAAVGETLAEYVEA